MSHAAIDPTTVHWTGVKHLDPLGKTFRHEDVYYKAIYPAAVEQVRQLFERGIIDELVGEGLLVPTRISERTMTDAPLLLEQDTEFFDVPPTLWNTEVLKEAAANYIRINQILLPHGMGLWDAHPYNFVLQANGQVRWCDIGSLTALAPGNNDGLVTFQDYYLHPLLFRSESAERERLARLFIKDGLSEADAKELGLPHVRITPPPHTAAGRAERSKFLTALADMVDSMELPWPQSMWSQYHTGLDPEAVDWNTTRWDEPVAARTALLGRIMDSMSPRHVIDYGANAGYFSILAARTGAQVLAVEADVTAAARCHLNCRKATPSLSVKVATASFPLCDRPGDLTLALALSHHLFFTHLFRFEIMAKELAKTTTGHLITEFMPNGLGVNGVNAPDPLPADYTIEHFTTELGRYFNDIDVAEYPGYTHRVLIIARDKKNG